MSLWVRRSKFRISVLFDWVCASISLIILQEPGPGFRRRGSKFYPFNNVKCLSLPILVRSYNFPNIAINYGKNVWQ